VRERLEVEAGSERCVAIIAKLRRRWEMKVEKWSCLALRWSELSARPQAHPDPGQTRNKGTRGRVRIIEFLDLDPEKYLCQSADVDRYGLPTVISRLKEACEAEYDSGL
jgi:hypothetical protein